ncbi:hypothetical protein EG329_006844 [Mollisiaceae sp. DMI_Dod_QoI]|nr:hypothetical protein EG329_006844 [Helotiales sp. DMI_Dod_QoI]
MDKSDDDFYGKTQALTVAYNGDTVKFYGHHAVQIPVSSQPASGGVDSSADVNIDALAYHQYVLSSDNPRGSFENFQNAYKHTRNAQDIGYKWAAERKDALWAYTNRDNTQASPGVATSAQQPSNDSLVSISPGTPNDYNYEAYDDGVPIPAQQPTDSLIPVSPSPPDGYNYDAYDDEVGPTDQLLRESWTDNGNASPDAQTYNPITPPQSSKDVSVPLESQQLSPTIAEPMEDVDVNARGHRKTRPRTRHAVAIEGPKEVVDNSKPRRTRTKHHIS